MTQKERAECGNYLARSDVSIEHKMGYLERFSGGALRNTSLICDILPEICDLDAIHTKIDMLRKAHMYIPEHIFNKRLLGYNNQLALINRNIGVILDPYVDGYVQKTVERKEPPHFDGQLEYNNAQLSVIEKSERDIALREYYRTLDEESVY